MDVTIAGYDTNSTTPTVAIWCYTDLYITQSTANPDFTGYISPTKFNKVVITGLSSSTTNANTTYGYPNAAFIGLDQTQVGNQAVPEPGTLPSLLFGGLAGIGAIVIRRYLRRGRQAKQFLKA